jgi:hypothetical protein
MRDQLESLTSRVETGELQTHDEIRREFLNIIEGYLEEKFGVLAHIKLERDVGDGFYDAAIGGNLYFEIKSVDEGFEAGIDDSIEYIESEDEPPVFFTTEGIHGAYINDDAEVVQRGNLTELSPRLRNLLDSAVSEPTATDIINAFGPQSERVQHYIEVLWNILQEHRDLPRVESAFSAWRDIYAEAANLNADARDAVQDQASDFGIDIDTEEETYEFLFAVQTYFAIFLKLFSARLGGEYDSTETRLSRGTWPETYRRLSVEAEIVEHDLFDWILDPSRESGDASRKIEDMVMRLATSVDMINPDRVNQDILRDIYQESFNSETRTAMGEFYTNDELVDEVLDEVGYNGSDVLDDDATLLDPTCGSGTFLFHAIQRYVDAAEEDGQSDREIVNGVTDNINGIDLHPFAVAMARTNYLLALGDRAEYADDVPVFWTDSLAPAAQRTLNGQKVTVSTLGSVQVPDPEDIGHHELFTAMERALEGGWGESRFIEEFDEGDRQRYENTLKGVYNFFTEEIHNGMWVPAFRDVAAVYGLRDECEFLVGNPPWVRNRNIEEDLRDRLQNDFEYYSDPWRPDLEEKRNPGSPPDYAIAFVEAGFEFLNSGGNIGYVITSSLARAMYAGKARQDIARNKNLKTIVDYTLAPHDYFPDASNKPLIVSAANEDPDGETEITLYNRENDVKQWNIDPENLSLEADDPRSPWILVPPTVVSGIRSMAAGIDRAGDRFVPTSGVKTAANDVFYVNSVEPTEDPDEVLVETEDDVLTRIEEDLLHPLISGGNIDEWSFDYTTFIIWLYDDDASVLTELPERVKDHVESYKDHLESRSDYLITTQLDDGKPYWVIGNVNEEKTDAKVGWQEIAKTIESAYLPSKIDVSLDTGVELGERHLIPTNKVLFFETGEDEIAKALTGVLNSTPARVYAGSYALRTGGRYCQNQAWTIGVIPVPDEIFAAESDTVTELVDQIHEREGDDELSEELDEEIADLYGLSEQEIETMDDFLEFFLAD